ncbi:MAG: hypothetical protein IPM53_24880 [Anaerolineaceae bacterium]|nr:hypothetical protein [Anaerolineaceae bacterium]
MPELHNVVRHQSHENRTKTGRVSATVTRKIANYLAYGRGRPAQQQQREPRGTWLDQKSQARTHDEVIAWVEQEGKAQRYTHQLILSVKDEWLTPEAYNQALAAGGSLFSAWRLMAHTDTSYSHAHVIAFGDKQIRFKSESFRDWWLTVRQALETEREAALAQRTAVPEHALNQELVPAAAAERSLSLQPVLEVAQPQQEAEAAWGMEWE